MKHDLDHYLQLPYPMEIVRSKDGGYFAQLPDLPGCISEGETIEEAERNLEEAKRGWIVACLEDGLEVPSPHEPVGKYSGRFLIRIPKSLHRELATRAQREATSLNQYVLHLLSLGLGREQEVKKFVDLLIKEEGQPLGSLDVLYGNLTTYVSDLETGLPSPPRHIYIGRALTQSNWVSLPWREQEESPKEDKDRPRELTDLVPFRWRR